jgi:hypothetical protein
MWVVMIDAWSDKLSKLCDSPDLRQAETG